MRALADEHPDAAFRGHPMDQLVGVTGGILEAEILRAQGHGEEARRVLEAAVELEDGIRYDEPEPLNFSARHWLGDLLLETGDAEAAEAVFRAALEDHPLNGWSLVGLESALRAQGRNGEAELVRRDFDTSWADADIWIRRPIF
jgi:tetratricopeptide (TPR) repeat protein